MARVQLSLVTDLLSSEIDNVDVMLVNRRNVNNNYFKILADFPSGMNMTDGIVLTAFSPLVRSEYDVILRIFLNRAPFVVSKFATVSVGDEDFETTIIVRRPG